MTPAIPVEVVIGDGSAATPCGFCCSDAGEACLTCTPALPAEVCHAPPHVCVDCTDCREAA
jgi:hypothetical protein